MDKLNYTELEKIIKARRSVRGFLSDPIDDQVLESIFQLAQYAPSNCNTQPWQVHIVSGASADRVRQALSEHIAKGEMQMDFTFIPKYSGIYKERQYDAAKQLYGAMEIAREDVQARHEAFMRNFSFFDAPYAALLFMPEEFSVREAADVGMYAQNLMLAMTAKGIASCPQAALSFHADAVREVLGIEENMKLLFGIAFGYEDVSCKANQTRVARAALSDVLKFHKD